MPEKRISSCSRAWPIPPPPPPPPWQSPRSSPKPHQQTAPPQTPAAATQPPLPSLPLAPPQAVPEVVAPPFVFILPPDTSGTAPTKRRFAEPIGTRWPATAPKKPPGTAGRKWRRSRGSVSSGRGTPGVQSPKADSVGSSVKMANIASNKATGNCPNTATVSFEDRERKRPKNPWADLSAPNPDLVRTVQRYCVPPRTTFTAKIKTVPTSS